jgi:hypothetical protein
MPWYQCSIRGENFPGAILGKKERIGFYTTRGVEAESAQEAEMKALADLKADKKLRLPKTQQSSKAKVFFEEIAELNRRPVKKPVGSMGLSPFGSDSGVRFGLDCVRHLCLRHLGSCRSRCQTASCPTHVCSRRRRVRS